MLENRRLSRQVEMLTERLREADEARFDMARNAGKNASRKAKQQIMTNDDLLNENEVVKIIKDVLFPILKILPKGWWRWNPNNRSICQRIMKVIRVPAGMEPQAYWDNLIAKIVNDKYCSLRANLKSGMLQTYKGNYYAVLVNGN